MRYPPGAGYGERDTASTVRRRAVRRGPPTLRGTEAQQMLAAQAAQHGRRRPPVRWLGNEQSFFPTRKPYRTQEAPRQMLQ